MIDVSSEARQQRRGLARRQVARLAIDRKQLHKHLESIFLCDIYNAEFTEYFKSTGKCPSCDTPIDSSVCPCGCHQEAGTWYQSHYTVHGGERIEDQRHLLWEWLENPFKLLMKGFVE